MCPSTVARQLDVTAETVRAWIRTEKIAAVRTPNGRYGIPVAVVKRLRIARRYL